MGSHSIAAMTALFILAFTGNPGTDRGFVREKSAGNSAARAQSNAARRLSFRKIRRSKYPSTST